jgi:hypothetical protein
MVWWSQKVLDAVLVRAIDVNRENGSRDASRLTKSNAGN